MESLPGYDNWKENAPEGPTHGRCFKCGSREDYGDMTEFIDEYYCDDCIDEAREEQERYDNR